MFVVKGNSIIVILIMVGITILLATAIYFVVEQENTYKIKIYDENKTIVYSVACPSKKLHQKLNYSVHLIAEFFAKEMTLYRDDHNLVVFAEIKVDDFQNATKLFEDMMELADLEFKTE